MGHVAALPKQDEEFLNTLGDLCAAVGNATPYQMMTGDQLSQTDTLFLNNRWYLISNLRQLLTQLYVEHGVIQTLCDQPVDDAFRAGFEIQTGQLDGDDKEDMMIFEERHNAIGALIQAKKWARLYGGGAVIIITDQDPATPLNLQNLNPDRLQFRDADMWELYFSEQNVQATPQIDGGLGEGMGDYYDYYGVKLHKSRVYRVEGKKCPSFLRPRLRGWGMSELEKIVRSLNQYLKNQDVIFSLLDEAKVDVHRIKGFTTSLLQPGGSDKVASRIQMANYLKSYKAALVMDKEDEYIQKQVAFTGLAEVLLQIRQGLAADLKMPMTKLFGVSAAGFSSGEDDIENYNSMLESEIRKPAKFQVVDLLQICSWAMYKRPIDDLMISFNPLRVLNAKEEEEVKDSKFDRVERAYSVGLMEGLEAKEAINAGNLLPVEIDATLEPSKPIDMMGDEGEDGGAKPASGSPGKTAPKVA